MRQDRERKTLSSRVASFLTERPVLSLLLGLLVVGATLPGLGRLKTDFTHRSYFYPDNPLLKEVDDLERVFGNDDSVVVAVHSPSGIFDPGTVAVLRQLTDGMWKVPDIIRVQSPVNFPWVHSSEEEITIESLLPEGAEADPVLLEKRREVALTHEDLPGYLLSKDGNTALVIGTVRPSVESNPEMPVVVAGTRELLASISTTDETFYLTGRAAINTAFKESMAVDMKKLVPAVFLLTMLALGFFFRRISGVLLPVVVILAVILMTLGISGWMGLKVSNVTSSVPQILIALSVAVAVHLLYSFYEARSQGMERRAAAQRSLELNFFPTFLTSITTVAGFFSFTSTPILALSNLGTMTGIGALLAWVFCFLLMGPLLALLPSRSKKAPPHGEEGASSRTVRYVDWVIANRRAILIGFGVLTVVTAYLSSLNVVNSNPFLYFTKDVPVRTANQFVEDQLGGTPGVEIVVDSGKPDGIKDPAFLRKVEEYQRWIESTPGVARAVSVVNILKQVNRALHGGEASAYQLAGSSDEIAQQLFLYTMNVPQGADINDRVSVNQDKLRISVLWRIEESNAAMATAARFADKARQMGLHAVNTGKMLLYQGMNTYVVRSFLISLILALLQISLILMLAVRSFKVGALALIPNLIPLLLGGTVMFLLRQPLDVGTVVVASICLGIVVDDTVHLIANFFRRRGEGMSNRQALIWVLGHTGSAVTIATTVLVIAFGAFAFASFVPNRNFGVFTATILGLGILVELGLSPALLAGLGGEPEPVPAESEPFNEVVHEG
ncbi:MAG TPA: MMPL family transporter [Thermoanaerobaculia bacterium]|nr:MMPL family transporter [Thermoanaerobaculia bacterium]